MQPEGFQRAIADIRLFSCPLVASAEAKSPAFGKEQLCLKDQQFGRAHLARQCCVEGQSSLGALLRERKVTGRDASLPAPLWAASLKLVARGTVGALPQTPQGAPPLDPARGNPPLDPFARLSWFLYHTPSACCSFGFASPFSPYFILNCSFAAPHWQCVIAHAIASAASSGFGISFIPSSSFTIC